MEKERITTITWRGAAARRCDGSAGGSSPAVQILLGVGRAGAISDVAAELIEHCAEWVTRDGPQLETILKI